MFDLLLPWFPIFLAAGLGGRLLGRSRGMALGLLCALFWLTLAQAMHGAAMWSNAWYALMCLTGSVAMVAVAGWSGESASYSATMKSPFADAGAENPLQVQRHEDHAVEALDLFAEWLEVHRHDPDPWAGFNELIRTVLYRGCRATHVRPYRLNDPRGELLPMWAPEFSIKSKPLSASEGVIEGVLSSRRSYVAGMESHRGAPQGQVDPAGGAAWIFPVVQGRQPVGVVVVHRLESVCAESREALRLWERLINRFWCDLLDANQLRQAVLDDPVSGLYTRRSFLHVAHGPLADAYRQQEPIALAVIAVERLRELSDSGRWDLADEAVRAVAATIKNRIRSDDVVGRFDGSRFVVLLRRVDQGLAHLIISQLMGRLQGLCGDVKRWGAGLEVRCGWANNGSEQPDLTSLVSLALQLCGEARARGVRILSQAPLTESRACREEGVGVASASAKQS